jgi:hypothetical protein
VLRLDVARSRGCRDRRLPLKECCREQSDEATAGQPRRDADGGVPETHGNLQVSSCQGNRRSCAAHWRDRCRYRAITADTDLRLCCFFGLSDGWWLRGQVRYDLERARDTMAKALGKIRPWSKGTSRIESSAAQ